MNRMIILLLSIFLFIALPSVSSFNKTIDHQSTISNNKSVFIEYATTTWCPQCPTASEVLYDLYTSNQYSFSYVSLVSDINPNAENRARQFRTVAIPTIYINGGKDLYIGNPGSYETLKDIYVDYIREYSEQYSKNDLNILTEAKWLGEGQIQINITIENDRNYMYFGILRTYVSEIISRWLDEQGNPYHYALLDFAFDEKIKIPRKSSLQLTTVWDGNENHQGLVFNDITKDNIILQSTISHWLPHLRLGYMNFPYYQIFFSYFIDATDTLLLP